MPHSHPASGAETAETAEAARKRMRMRSWRRGTKEMDLILGPFADDRLAAMSAGELAAYDALLEENDQDLLAWVTGAAAGPAQHAGLIATIRADALARGGPVKGGRADGPAGGL